MSTQLTQLSLIWWLIRLPGKTNPAREPCCYSRLHIFYIFLGTYTGLNNLAEITVSLD